MAGDERYVEKKKNFVVWRRKKKKIPNPVPQTARRLEVTRVGPRALMRRLTRNIIVEGTSHIMPFS